ncbi:MAG: hypothetical protein ACI85K_001065 [Hyphomicrobiaceae bacterium]
MDELHFRQHPHDARPWRGLRNVNPAARYGGAVYLVSMTDEETSRSGVRNGCADGLSLARGRRRETQNLE